MSEEKKAAPDDSFEGRCNRIAEKFMDVLQQMEADAGEGCAAASWVFQQAIRQVPEGATRDQLRAACIKSMSDDWGRP